MRFALLLVLFLPTLILAEPLRIFASVLPIQAFIQKVGGEHVDVHVMVKPNHNPASYNPSPQQIAVLAKAKLYVRTGVPFESAWMERIRATNQTMDILDVREGIKLRHIEAHHHHEEHQRHEQSDNEQEFDPHVWTSPQLVQTMISAIRDKLIELDPKHRSDYEQNHDAFGQALALLDQEIQTLLTPLKGHKFMVFHPSWGYFAEAYDLQQVAIEHEGKQPGARALVKMINQANDQNIRVVFVQPQFDQRQAEQVAKAIKGTVIAIDPLAANYIDNLRAVAQQFAKALQP